MFTTTTTTQHTTAHGEVLAAPTIHTNGTSRASLFDGYVDAGTAIREAISKLEDAAPHGRDYYLQGEGAYKVAERQHLDRLARLQSVLAEITHLVEHCT